MSIPSPTLAGLPGAVMEETLRYVYVASQLAPAGLGIAAGGVAACLLALGAQRLRSWRRLVRPRRAVAGYEPTQ